MKIYYGAEYKSHDRYYITFNRIYYLNYAVMYDDNLGLENVQIFRKLSRVHNRAAKFSIIKKLNKKWNNRFLLLRKSSKIVKTFNNRKFDKTPNLKEIMAYEIEYLLKNYK